MVQNLLEDVVHIRDRRQMVRLQGELKYGRSNFDPQRKIYRKTRRAGLVLQLREHIDAVGVPEYFHCNISNKSHKIVNFDLLD